MAPRKPRTDALGEGALPPRSEADVPERVTVRINAELRTALAAFCSKNNMRLSSTLRTLLFVALKADAMGGTDAAFKAAAFREGVVEGSAAFKRNLQEAITKTMAESGGLAEEIFSEEGSRPARPSRSLKPYDPNEGR